MTRTDAEIVQPVDGGACGRSACWRRMTTVNDNHLIDSAAPHTARESRAEGERLLTESASLVGRGWCQGALALDNSGRRVEPWHESATRWSPLGALLRAWYRSPKGDLEAFRLAYNALATATGGRLEAWNAAPWRTQRHVLNAFGRARPGAPAVSTRAEPE